MQNLRDRIGRNRNVFIELFAAAAIAALIWALKWFFWGAQPIDGDGPAYLRMARGEMVFPPQNFHILTPRLAGWLFPDDPMQGFIAIAVVSFVGATVAVDLILRKIEFKLSFAERALGTGLFFATCTGAFMFRNYFWTDSLSYFLLAVACAATLYGRNGLVAVATLVGVFNRETALFIIPVWIIYNFGKESVAVFLRRFALTFLPAFTGYYVLHKTPLFFGYDPLHLNYLEPEIMIQLFRETLGWLGTDNIFYGLSICVFLAYSAAWFLAAVGVLANFRLKNIAAPSNALWALALPVLATLLLVDWRRGFQPIFPAVIVSAVLGVRLITANLPKFNWYLLAIASAVASAVMTEAWYSTPMRTPVIIAFSGWLAVLAFVLGFKFLRNGQYNNEADFKN